MNKLRVFVVSVLVVLSASAYIAPPSEAAKLLYPDGTPLREQKLIDWMLFDNVPDATGVIYVHLDRCFDGVHPACAIPGHIWFDYYHTWWTTEMSVKRQTWLHELGHHFDYTIMGTPHRDYFRYLIGDSRPWRTSPNSPHEKFAEAYQLCGRGVYAPPSGYDYQPPRYIHDYICRLIRAWGGWG